MSDKIRIRFLKPGQIEVNKPENFDEMTMRDKINWANDILTDQTDSQILEALADFDKEMWNKMGIGMFDADSIIVEAIQNEDGETMMCSEAWDNWENNNTYDDWRNILGDS
jgi:hypothetical protein